MPSPQGGFQVVWDVVPLDVGWVLVPGLAALAVAAGLLLLRLRTPSARPRRRWALAAAAIVLWLLAVWWTLGGVGAWRVGVARLGNATATVAEGTLEVSSPRADAFRVADLSLQRSWDAWAPALHATRWPPVQRFSGQRVRVTVFYQDVLRLEVASGP